MRSVTLSSEEKRGWFSPALFRKNAARFWPMWAVYAVGQFFALPMELMMRSSPWEQEAAAVAIAFRKHVFGAIRTAGFFGGAFGLLFAMALFSYLMDSRQVGMIHALPIRREGLFLTNFALALCGFFIPDLLVGGMAVAAGAVAGVNLLFEVFLWGLVQVTVGMFFFSFAVFCAMFTGNILALPVFYGILNVLAAGVSVLLDVAMSVLLVGFSGGNFADSRFTQYCTPVWNITQLLSADGQIYGSDGELVKQTMTGLTSALGYSIVLFAVFSSVALAVYRLRELERAGDLVTVGWVRPVFQFGLGTCVGLTGGAAVYMRFFYGWSPAAFIALTAVWAVVGAFAGRMLLKKTVRVFADGWRGPVVLGLCLVALLVGARMDFFGYQRWVPDPAQVEAVLFNNAYTMPQDVGSFADLVLTDPEEVKTVVEFHQALVSDLADLRRVERGDTMDPYTYTAEGYETEATRRVYLTYILAGGGQVRRRWTVPIYAAALDDPASPSARLQALFDRPGVVEQLYYSQDVRGLNVIAEEAVGGYLDHVKSEDGEEAAETDKKAREKAQAEQMAGVPMATVTPIAARNTIDLTVEEARALYAAVRKDMKAGNIGRRYLLNTRERYENCYQTDLCLNLLQTYLVNDTETGEVQRKTTTWTVGVTVQKSATETLKVLEEIGYADRLQEWDK